MVRQSPLLRGHAPIAEAASALEIVRLFIASRSLQAAALRSGNTPLPALRRVEAQCWWAQRSRQQALIGALEEQLQGRVHHVFVDAEHEAIVADPEFLKSVVQRMYRLTEMVVT